MQVLHFHKDKLGNLEYSLRREMLSTDRTGGYMSTTIICCNTRKYHGLMVCPLEGREHEGNFVLLSSVDETIIQHDKQFNLGIHRFPGVYEPRGHKYITDFEYTPIPTWTYRVGGVVLKKELLWIHARPHLLIRYTLLEATSETALRLRPFLAFRNAHTVSAANASANGDAYPITDGVRCRLYEDFPWLHMQTDDGAHFFAAQDWYYNFEYPVEADRGYPYREDLVTPGAFEVKLVKNKPVIFSCSLQQEDAGGLQSVFESERVRRSDKIDLISCLRHAARQFVVRKGDRTEVIAGYPWFGRWGRDTFISLPGITLAQGDVRSCIEVLDTMTREIRGGLFPNMGNAYNSVDAPLWFFYTLQALEKNIGPQTVWTKYGTVMKDILEAFRSGIGGYIRVGEDGLLSAYGNGKALTWMDAVVDGVPVTARDGKQVEINGLWYNAVCYTLHLAREFGDREFIRSWEKMPRSIQRSFSEQFWYDKEGYLYDYIDDGVGNTFIRPNQIICCSLEHTMLDRERMISIINTVRQHLLTPKGLRTLSPRNPLYEGRYYGDQPTRDRQYHQGTVWPWLLEHYATACFRVYGDSFIEEASALVTSFEEDLSSYGIGSVAEIYDGDPPHEQKGAISQAWSVGAVLRIKQMITERQSIPAGSQG